MRTYLGKIALKFEDEDIYEMRRTLSSKLLALCAETGVRQRILGHLEGSTVDRYYSDHGLPELKALLDQVDYGLQVGRASDVSFPVIMGCSAPMLPSVDVVIHLSDDSKICAIRVCDTHTDETVIAARVEGASTPHDDEAKTFEVLAAQEIANGLLTLQQSHSLTLPASEVALAAFEHLLFLEFPPLRKPTQCPRNLQSQIPALRPRRLLPARHPLPVIIPWLRMLQQRTSGPVTRRSVSSPWLAEAIGTASRGRVWLSASRS